jgi:hypothetical protein
VSGTDAGGGSAEERILMHPNCGFGTEFEPRAEYAMIPELE